jgi:transcriptional regulator with XRE-family HTH domain
MAESHLLDSELPLETAGQTLCRAREAAGLSRAQIAEQTKIPERHLAAIEQDNFGALPARTYAVGFSRSYARALGLDEAEIARLVRADLDGAPEPIQRTATFEPGDPARIPSSAFAWVAGILALGVVVAGYVFWQSYYSPAAELPPIAAETPAADLVQAAPVAAVPATTGQVVFTALEPGVWVKFYDTTGQLLQKEMAQGESYSVPLTARSPMIWTARPQALGVTVDGKPVAKLAETQTTLKDVPVTAAALLARPAARPITAAPVAAAPQPRQARAPAPRASASAAPVAPLASPTPEASTVSP